MRWVYFGLVLFWVLGCAALMAAVSTLEKGWVVMAVLGLGMTLGWVVTSVAALARRQPRRIGLLWPIAVAVVVVLHVTHLPLMARVLASEGGLTELVEAARVSRPDTGRAGLFRVSRCKVVGRCVFLEVGESLDGVAGLLHVPDDIEPPYHPDWSHTVSHHLTGPWWYFETRS